MRIVRRLIQWWRFRTHGAELQEELSFHREAIERGLLARGHSAESARAGARRAMGNETLMREESRGVWLWPSLEEIWQDARTTIRSLGKSPAFTFGVMLTFALGVGANAAMFSFIDRLMFRPPPFLRDAATVHRVHLFRLRDGVAAEGGTVYPRYADMKRAATSFSQYAGHSVQALAVGVGQDAREMRIGVVTWDFFEFFDAPPALGRYFTAAEDAPPDGAAVAVLSYPTWQARYGGRREALGSTLHIGARVYTVIGVAPRGFAGIWTSRPPAAFIPVAAFAASQGRANWPTNYGWGFNWGSLARRKPEVSLVQANADLSNALVQSYRTEGAGVPTRPPASPSSSRGRSRGRSSRSAARRGPMSRRFPSGSRV